MKKYICILVLISICVSTVLLVSCRSKGSNNEMNEILTLESVLTKEYDISEIRSYFEDKNANEPTNFDGTSQNLHFNDVNQHFPVEVIRPGGYTVYAISQGGYYYVFWSEFHTTDDNLVNDNSFVYFTAYLPSLKELSVFESLKVGISTAEDVKAIDSSFELSFLMSSGIFSYSFLNDESILEIEYDVEKELEEYDDLIVKKITVISRSTAPSRYSSILTIDLPQR